MADDILKPTLSIKVGGEEFILRVPTPMERARIGVREASIRRSLDDPMAGGLTFPDEETYFLIRGMAVLETLLEQSSAKWAWSEAKGANDQPKLVVKPDNFPPGKENVVAEVGRQFQETLDRFHRDRAEHTRPVVSETVDGGGNPGAL